MQFLKNILLLNLLCYLVISCKDTLEHHDDILQINIPLQAKEIHLPADSLFCDKDILALETTSDNLISNIDKMEIANNNLYLLDKQQNTIFIFNQQGKYIHKIADIGRGPDEYIGISDFHIDDTVLYLCTESNGGKIMCYDLQGRYRKSFSTEYPSSCTASDSNHLYVYYNFSYSQGYNVGVYDKEDHSLVKRYKPYPEQQAGIGHAVHCWDNCGKEVYASFPYEYKIYALQADTCQVIAHIDFGKNHMFPPEYEHESCFKHQDYIAQTGGSMKSPIVQFCSSLFVTPQKIVFTFVYSGYNHICIIDRQTHAMKFGIPWPNEYYWNIHALHPIYVSDEYFVKATSPSRIINYRDQHGKTDFAEKEWTLDITEESNPCLYFYKLKK